MLQYAGYSCETLNTKSQRGCRTGGESVVKGIIFSHVSWGQNVPLWLLSVTVAQHFLCINSLLEWWHPSGMRLCFWEFGMVECVWSWQDTVSPSGSNHLLYKLFQPSHNPPPFPQTPFLLHRPYHSTHNDMPFFPQRPCSFGFPPLCPVSSGLLSVSTCRCLCYWQLVHLQSQIIEYVCMHWCRKVFGGSWNILAKVTWFWFWKTQPCKLHNSGWCGMFRPTEVISESNW